MSEWQPIETAPKDGTWFVIATAHGDYEVGRYEPLTMPTYEPVDGTCLYLRTEREVYEWGGFNNFHAATHWMPLPAPPVLP